MEELFRLTQAETGMLSQDAYPDMSASYPVYTELYRYQVPVDRRLIFKPGHTFSIYAKYLNENLDAMGYDDNDDILYENMATINEEAGDAVVTSATPASGDYTFFGYRYKFKSFKITGVTDMDMNDADADTQWDYWNGSSWSDLPNIVDGTNGLSNTTVASEVSFSLPADWTAKRTVGSLVFLVRYLIASYSSGGAATTVSDAAVHDDEVVDNGDLFKVEVRDQNELVRKPLINQSRYKQCDEFADRDLIRRLDISEVVVAKPGDWVVISTKAISPVDVSNCYFVLTCDREMGHIL